MKIKTRNIDELYSRHSLINGRKYYSLSNIFQFLSYAWMLGVFSITFWKIHNYALIVVGSIVEIIFIFTVSRFYRKAIDEIKNAEMLHMKIDDKNVRIIKDSILFENGCVVIQGRTVYSGVEISYM